MFHEGKYFDIILSTITKNVYHEGFQIIFLIFTFQLNLFFIIKICKMFENTHEIEIKIFKTTLMCLIYVDIYIVTHHVQMHLALVIYYCFLEFLNYV